MIKNFEIYIPATKIAYEVIGKINELVPQEAGILLEINNSFRQGIRWENNCKLIQLENKEGSITGYVSVDWKYVLATHYRTPNIDFPRNAVVYNADGTVHLYLDPEKILAHHPSEKRNFLLDNMGFNSVKWLENSKGVIVLAIEVVYAGGYFSETWEVDSATGEFGELLYKERDK